MVFVCVWQRVNFDLKYLAQLPITNQWGQNQNVKVDVLCSVCLYLYVFLQNKQGRKGEANTEEIVTEGLRKGSYYAHIMQLFILYILFVDEHFSFRSF